MTPDMRRLCEPVEQILEDAGLQNVAVHASFAKAVGRAVLTGLRAGSGETTDAMVEAIIQPRPHMGNSNTDEVQAGIIAIHAVIDHVLNAEVAKERQVQAAAQP